MKHPSFFITIFALAAILSGLVYSCNRDNQHQEPSEIAISRSLERAIELGEMYLRNKDLLSNIAMTEGTDAAIRKDEDLRLHDTFESFWAEMDYADSLCARVDSTKRDSVIAHLMPLIDRLQTLVNEFN